MLNPITSAATRAVRAVREHALHLPPAGATRFDSAYWSLIDRYAGRPPARSNHTQMMRDPAEAWQARIDGIRGAKRAIFGSLYMVYPDEKGFEFVKELIAARKRGVEVCIAVDATAMKVVEVQHGLKAAKQLHALFGQLEAAGGVVSWAGTIDDHLRRPGSGVHFKSLVFDNETAVVGGRNIGKPYYTTWTDFDTKVDGPVVRTLAAATLKLLSTCDATEFGSDDRIDGQFEEVTRRLRALLGAVPPPEPADPQEPPVDFHLITFDPLEDRKNSQRPNTITQALIETFDRAQEEIFVTSNVLMPDPQLRAAMVRAAKRGVKVRLVTAGEHLAGALAHGVTRVTFDGLVKAGCEVYQTRSHEHGKLYVVDGQVGAYGSYNASEVADSRNAEGLLFTADPRVIAELERCVEEKIADCDAYVPPHDGLVGHLKHLLERLFG